jgi:hypothetical protein
MTTLAAPAGLASVALPRWSLWAAEVWWALRALAALEWLTVLWLGRVVRFVVRLVLSCPPAAVAPLASTMLAAGMGARGVLAWAADPRPLWTVLAPPAAALVGFVGFCVWGCVTGAGAARHVHAAYRREAAKHEAMHAAVARHVRAWVSDAWIDDYGNGQTLIHDTAHPIEQQIAITIAGGIGTGRSIRWSHQCTSDSALLDQHLATVPRRDHAAVMAKARAICRAGINAQSSYARRIEQKLLEKGHL